MIDHLQFYPTPPALAREAWAMFENKHYSRILEPSAGRGDLLLPALNRPVYSYLAIDVIEANLSHHPVLREKGCRVIDTDFLRYHGIVGYDRIIMNPPFTDGVSHVLHAWSLLRDGELVAIINAETLTNPYSEKRRFLKSLIAEHGRVKFIDSAFQDPDTFRRTNVRVALVHLCKESDITLNATENLAADNGEECHVDGAGSPNSLMLPNSTIKNTVLAFKSAVESMKKSVIAEAEANYYHSLIEVKIQPQKNDDQERKGSERPAITFRTVQSTINKRYDELKEHAWRRVLGAADFTSRFSSKVRKDIESQLDDLIHMEFTVDNIHALLGGLIANKTELDYQMLEEVFDQITKYHMGNRFHYKGWKSNDKHRIGFKIRPTRFILPHMKDFMGYISWEAKEQIRDIDQAFALLDGKTETVFSMCDAIENHKDDVRDSVRVSSDYFDIRFFRGAGTLHFFPRRADLIDRLNRIVGKRRQWLPDSPADAPEAFWIQYDKADAVSRKMDKYTGNESEWRINHNPEILEEAHRKACDDMGIPDFQSLGTSEPAQLLLA